MDKSYRYKYEYSYCRFYPYLNITGPCEINPCPKEYVCREDGNGGRTCDDPCFYGGVSVCMHNKPCKKDGNGGYDCVCGEYYGRNCEHGKLVISCFTSNIL